MTKVRGIDYDPNWGYAAGVREAWNKGKSCPRDFKLPDEAIFVKDSPHARIVAKRRVIRKNLIPYICAGCGNTGKWNNKPLSLHLEHKNGDPNDHRLENLEFDCPNCHSQTETYAGKNKGKCARNTTG